MDILVALFLLILGYVVGRILENRHYRSIHAREAAFLSIPTVNWRNLQDPREVAEVRMVMGGVVISVDYYKRFLAAFRKIFGGELRSYSPLMDRARREALLRMKEQFPDADAYLNVRFDTSPISKGMQKATGTVEIFASGTGIKYCR